MTENLLALAGVICIVICITGTFGALAGIGATGVACLAAAYAQHTQSTGGDA